MIKIVFVILSIIFLAGCSTVKPPVTEYKLSTKKLDTLATSKGCIDKSLKISQAFSSSSLMSLKMNYVEDKNKIYAYSQAQWSNSPNQEITAQIVKGLRESKLFKTTLDSKSRSKSDLILEVSIEDFMQYYNKDLDNSYSNVVVTFTLIDSVKNQVIDSKTISSMYGVNSLDANGGVKALNIALEDVLRKSVEFLNEACR